MKQVRRAAREQTPFCLRYIRFLSGDTLSVMEEKQIVATRVLVN
jgi:hypothetical protein